MKINRQKTLGSCATAFVGAALLATGAVTVGAAQAQAAPANSAGQGSASSSHKSASSFTVTIPGSKKGALPVAYTCDGQSLSPALTWVGAPKGTASYAIVMDHVPPDGGHHWYLLEWGIPVGTRAIPAGSTTSGVLGGNSVNRDIGYAPPCSKGPGAKTYTITVYALSATPALPTSSSASVTRDQLLSAISGITLSKAVLDVTYTR